MCADQLRTVWAVMMIVASVIAVHNIRRTDDAWDRAEHALQQAESLLHRAALICARHALEADEDVAQCGLTMYEDAAR